MRDTEATREIERRLESGERLLWSGAPREGLALRRGDLFMVPFSLVWGGFAIFWEWTAFTGNTPLFFLLWGVPFVLIGLYMIVGRFFADAWHRARSAYGLTDQRIVIVSGLWSRTVTSVPLKMLGELSIEERADGSGTITFGPRPAAVRWTPAGMPGARGISPVFEMVPHAQQVYRQVREAQRNA